jgi:transglutaminase-like putative cysteine protease
MRNYIVVFIMLGFLIHTIPAKAQEEGAKKFGKLTPDELSVTICPIDSSAEAMVLFDVGKSYFIYTDQDGFKIRFDRHRRIKIFTKEGYDNANVEIPLYHSEGEQEVVSNLKAQTYNLVDNKVVTSKLENKSIFTEVYDENWDLEKFTMPDVKEGCVIEYSYSVISEFFSNLQEWEFQASIPILWSEYEVTIPEYFHYYEFVKGYEPFYLNDKENVQDFILVKSGLENDARDMNSQIESTRVTFNALNRRLVAKNVPALKNEPFTNSRDNYLTQIDFELSSIQFPQQTIKNFSLTWESINKLLLESEHFGTQLNRGFTDEITQVILSGAQNDEEKIDRICTYVRQNMKWDGRNRMSVDKSIKDAFKNGTGSSADINFILVCMLRSAELQAYPVVLSTRENGIIHPAHPTLMQLNYVVAMVKTGDKTLLLDATDTDCPTGMLPYRCLNGSGRIVDPKLSDWVEIKPSRIQKETIFIEMSMDEEGSLNGTYKVQEDGYEAFTSRKEIKAQTTREEYIKSLEENNAGLEIVSWEISNLDSISKLLEITLETEIMDQTDFIGDKIYFNPMLYEQMKENPFKHADRKFPVDFGAPVSNSYYFKLHIPDGYKIESMPEGCIISLPNSGGKFTYNVTLVGDLFQVISKMDINQIIFLPNEYGTLREFFHQIVNKQAQQVVLSKIN